MFREPGSSLPAKTIAAADRRADTRDEVFLRTTASHSPARTAKVELVNISPTGFLIRTRDHFTKGQKIMIALPDPETGRGEVAAEVRWSLTGCAGCCFAQPFAADQYGALLRRIRSAPRDWIDQPKP